MTSRIDLPPNPFQAPERALAPQSTLDDYEIERVIAQSSFAVVYRAYDPGLKLHVAIKEYLPDALALRGGETQVVLRARVHAERFQQGLQAFLAEAQTLARCDHPSLVRILRILQRNGTAYRVMRYAPGPTLLAHRRERGAMPDPAAMQSWLEGLLGALEALHEEGCVHGAVAPGNILLLPGDKPLLLDFDAVRGALISDRTQSMMAALEPSFAAPEQLDPSEGSSVGPWSDLYALATTLRFCISGELPAPAIGQDEGASLEPLAVVWRRRSEDQPGPGDPPPWLDALDACLRDDPQARPQSVARFRSLAGRGAARRRPPAPRATPRTLAELKLTSASASNVPDPPAQSAAAPPAPASAQAEPAPPEASSAPVETQPGRGSGPSTRPSPAVARPLPSAGHVVETGASPHAHVIADLDRTFAFVARQATEDAAAPPEEAAPARPAVDSAVRWGAWLTGRRGPWLIGAVGALLLAALAGVGLWMLKEMRPGGIGGPKIGPTAGSASVVMPAEAALLQISPPAAGPVPSAPALPADRPPAKAEKPVPAPRSACGQRSGLALLECMQEQCAKRAYAKHPQCIRLRKEQKL